jgi:hypothetical protein
VNTEDTVTGQCDEYVLVPRNPTRAMLEAGWADAHDEDAAGVWRSMVKAWELTNKHGEIGQG